jgi:hypothetical protein
MKYRGTVTELNSAMSLADSDFDLTAVIVTKERIAIEWQEGAHFGLVLHPIDADSTLYTGLLTSPEWPGVTGYYTAYRWDIANKGILLLATWKWNGDAGVCMFELTRPEA